MSELGALKKIDIVSNEEIDEKKVQNAKKIILNLQNELISSIKEGGGPFLAAVFEGDKLIAKAFNTVINENCSNNHAEVNVIKKTEKILNTYDLSKYNLKLYVTSEPCIMCLGAIMWSGIKEIYYGVPSKIVEEITGFDEGFKPDWFNEFKSRGITVYGNIEVEEGIKRLKEYVLEGKTIYKPLR